MNRKNRRPSRFVRTLACAIVFVLPNQAALVRADWTVSSVVTIENPSTSPAGDIFGGAVTALGGGYLAVGASWEDTGASDTGSVHIFDAAGTYVRTIDNPTPRTRDFYGSAIASLGPDKLVIGAFGENTLRQDEGIAYVYGIDGSLLHTVDNPDMAASTAFGIPIIGIGDAGFVVAAYRDNTGAQDTGSVYLFDSGASLQQAIRNPAPGAGDYFGGALGTIGTSMFAVGASYDNPGTNDGGSVYLYNADGTLDRQILNPSDDPDYDYFGTSVAGLGDDKIVIGAHRDDTDGQDCGMAYVFDTSGQLLQTVHNPAPDSGDEFGVEAAALGDDKFLVTARRDDSGATDSGTVYMFSEDGHLLLTIHNPNPGNDDRFGSHLAPVGNNSFLVGVSYDDTDAVNAGIAYLYTIWLQGDFSYDGDVDADDIDILCANMGGDPSTYDLDGDLDIDEDDMIFHVENLVELQDGSGRVGTKRGDMNLDGYVNATDLAAMKPNFGFSSKLYADGDLNCDGVVNATDLAILSANFGFAAPTGQAIPEPVTTSLLALGGLATLKRKK